MMREKFNHFELLLFAAAEDAANDVAEEFINVDTSRVEISPQGRKAVERYIRKSKRKTQLMRPVKVILIACLIALSVAFTACMAIPQVREAMTEAIIQWYDDFFTISFEDEPGDNSTPPPPHEEIPAEPPKEIEKKAGATYLPGKYSYIVASELPTLYELHYHDSTGNLVFMLTQSIIDKGLLWNDSSDAMAQEVTVNGHKAFLVSYTEEPNVYTLIWQDQYYQYSIYGYFEKTDELMKIAEGIQPR